MASDAAIQPLPREHETSAQPYPPSWVDQLIAWIERLPGPSWAFYVAAWLVQLALVTLVRWSGRTAPIGTFDPFFSSFALFNVYFLALIHYLDREASRALDAFKPALNVGDAEFARLRYELTTMPARGAFISSIIGLLVGGLVVLLGHNIVAEEAANSTVSAVVLATVLVGGFANMGVFFYHTYRQLQLVSRIYSMAKTIDLFRFAPLYAFSRLTARTGAGYILVVYIVIIVRPEVTLANPALVTVLTFQILVAIACFVVPLLGMHSRLVVEKQRLQAEADQRMEGMLAELYRRVDERVLGDADKLQTQMASLVIARDVLAKIPTWPWQPGTLTAFVTALFLPIVLWIITRLLERFF